MEMMTQETEARRGPNMSGEKNAAITGHVFFKRGSLVPTKDP